MRASISKSSETRDPSRSKSRLAWAAASGPLGSCSRISSERPPLVAKKGVLYLCIRPDEFHSWNPLRNGDIQTPSHRIGTVQDEDGGAPRTRLLPEHDQHADALAIHEGEVRGVK